LHGANSAFQSLARPRSVRVVDSGPRPEQTGPVTDRERVLPGHDPADPDRRREEPAAVPGEPLLLRDARIEAPQLTAVRASLARSLQAGIGNRGVGGMLMRDPPAAAPPKIAHKTGKEVDDALDASPFFAKLVETKHKAGTKAEGHVNIHNDAAFEEAYVKMALTKTNPDTGNVFTEEEARARSKRVNAFADKGEIHVHENRGEPGTTIHESMHLFSTAYTKKMGYNANEGTTEYFTKKLCAEIGLARGTFYSKQLASVEKLITTAGEDVVAAAYFQDKLAELETAVDAKKEAGTFGKWLTAMKASKYADADALL
jgi:hypothetical protein